MSTFLDLMIIVLMVLVAASPLVLCLMFLVRNPHVKQVCFDLVVVLGIYAASVGMRIGMPLFFGQVVLGVVVGIINAFFI